MTTEEILTLPCVVVRKIPKEHKSLGNNMPRVYLL